MQPESHSLLYLIKSCCLQANKEASSYRYKTINYWDMISVIYSRDRATGVGARTAAESGSEMAEENANQNRDNDDASSTQSGDRKSVV